MDIFLRSISGILVILGMILVGFVIGEKGWFDDKSRGCLLYTSYPDRGKLIFVTALFGSHLFGLAMLWVRDKKKNQKTSPI